MTAPFTPEAAPAASAEPQAPGGDQGQQGTEQQQAPAGADPAVLQQMQSQMEQFGGQLGEIAQYMPAMQQLAQQNGGQQQQGEPSLEDLAAQFFGDPGYQDPAQGQPMFDPYTGEPVQQQQPRFDPYTGAPLQPQAQQQPQVGPFQGDPAELVNLFRQIANEAVAPIQQREVQQQWTQLYEEFPQFNDPQEAPRIAERVARAAQLFSSSPEEAQRFAQNPQFVRFAHLASVNEAQGRGELPAGATDGPNPIEGGSGASAAGGQEIDPGDAIVNAGRNGSGGAGSYFTG
jgi:hypothetical protein